MIELPDLPDYTPEEEALAEALVTEALKGFQILPVGTAEARGPAVREFPIGHGLGCADYLLYVDGRIGGVTEAKKEGTTLTLVEVQTDKYGAGSRRIRVIAWR